MKKFLRFCAAGVLLMLWGVSTLTAQEPVYSAAAALPGAQNQQGLGFSWADFNHDGTLDLFVEPDNLIVNNGTSFTRVASGGPAFNVAMVGSIFADINGDGYPDVLTTQGSASPRLYLYNPVTKGFDDATATSGDLATITSGTTGQMYGLAAGDYDRDGYVDLMWGGGANAPAGGLRLLKGSASGFVNVGTSAAAPVIDTLKRFESWNPYFVDANNDGYLDIFLPSFRSNLLTGGSRSVLYLNNGNGTFSVPAPGLYTGPVDTGLVVGDTVRHYSAIGSAWADFNNDGIMDVILTALGGEEQGSGLRLLKGNGNGTFVDVTAASGLVYNNAARGLAWGDYNNDGWIDLLQSRGFAPPIVWRNNGDGTFTNTTTTIGIPAAGFNTRSTAFIDYDGDGFLDIYGVPGDALWRNGGNLNNWIAFKATAAGQNGMGVGTRFTVYTNGGTTKQIRNIEAGGSGGATGGNVWAQFGIGVATSVDSVVASWPDGTRQKFTGLAINRYWSVTEGSVVPATPALATPANGASAQTSPVTLTWGVAAGAVGYHVQVSLDAAFADPSKMVLDASTAGTSQGVTVGLGDTYYWRVAATNGGFASAYSAANSFSTVATAATQVPALVSPANAAIDQPGLITLVCSKTTDASQYNWQVSTLPSFSGFSVNDSTVDTTHTVQLVAGRTYYWRVRGVNGLGASGFATAGSFTVLAAPATPALVSPANNAQNTRVDTLNLYFRAVAGASNYVTEVSRSSAAGLVVNTYTTTDTTVQLRGLLNLTNYFWRVRAYNIGGSSLFSGSNGFTTIISAPAAPALVSPSTSTDVNRLTTFLWRSSVNATKYRLQVATDNAFTTVVRDTVVNFDTTLTLANHLDTELTYFWRVAAQNIGGQGGYSTAAFFTTGLVDAIAAPSAGIPTVFALQQNYPNPFNPSTTIRYEVPKRALVKIVVYDILGRVVATLVDGVQSANRYSVEWNATGVSTGVYFCRMEARGEDGSGNFNSVMKLLLLK